MTYKEILARLKILKPELQKRYKVRTIGLFGSWVHGGAHSDSDIDVLVEFEEGADLFDWIGLSFYLEDIFGRPVDVVTRKALRKEFQHQVLKEAIPV